MTTKLVICDIDATLVNEKKELTPRTKKALIKLHEKGIEALSECKALKTIYIPESVI